MMGLLFLLRILIDEEIDIYVNDVQKAKEAYQIDVTESGNIYLH